MRKSVLAVLVVACGAMVFAGIAVAKGGGNSPNAKLCQKGGWQLLVQADGSSFVSEQDCVSYAARGGTLTNAVQFACESFGGEFETGTLPDLWACEHWDWNAAGALFDQRYAALFGLCHASPGNQDFFTDAETTVEASSFCRNV
jgi:hypothetical protein